ncbi:putative E3 ubiquitin-protein ligase HERC3 isoform X1 [Huso huso]|uniref:E3 ubiquitin-protein ligase HERC3 isoform X1 n=1 Tax=Huso huso TaxID=61971 RepID=A0ABR1AAL8_HUSHU
MLCWGNTAAGELGLGDTVSTVFEPRSCEVFNGRGLKDIACGGHHSVFLLSEGSVYTCGSNSCGQLGHEKGGSRPEVVGALDAQKIVAVSCGKAHTLAVSEQGQVFSWGAGSDGQLGLGTTEEVVKVPRLIKKLCEHRITQVMCGSQHCIALSRDGQLFTWGQNTNGQLGLGKGEPSKPSPQPLKSLSGIPLAQIAAGGDHSFAVSLSGAVFGWGRNHAGQLGLNDEQDRAVPCHIKSLRSQKVVYISCGEEHTAALTKDGGLFTFGAGSHGQLGHDSTNNEFLPRRVLELMGSEVTQIACGRQHTLVFVPSSGLVYAFGCNSKGQLGNGCVGIAKSPQPVKGSLVAHKGQLSPLPDKSEQYAIRRIHCGGDHNFLMCSKFENSVTPEDFRFIHCTKSISVINNDNLNLWRQKLMENIDSNAVNDIILLLSSTACWNASFLDQTNDGHFKTNPKIPGIDLNSVRLLFKTLMKPPYSRLLEQATKSFESLLIPQLSCSPPDVEAMRIYLILYECPVLNDSKYYITLTVPLAMAILRLDTNPSKVLDNWWSSVDSGVFTRLVEMYKRIVVFLLSGGKTLLIPVFLDSYISAALKLLEKLHKVNLKAQHVEYDQFYIPGLTSLVDIQEDYLKWFLNMAENNSVTLCAYPFIFNAPAKTKMLQTDAELQMQIAVNGANLHNVFMLLTLEPMLARNPFLVLHVRRVSLVSDTLRELSICSDVDLKKPLKVIFDGEEAVDAGGLTKEFFLLLLKELLDPVYGMFTQYKESNLLWFSDKCFVEHNWFHLIGITCGLAIYNSTVVDLQFPLALYKKLLGVPTTLVDLKELSPTEGRSLQQLLDYPGDDVEETFCLNFAIARENYGLTEVKELVPGGENITVKTSNRQEFVEAYLNYIFNQSIEELYLAFSSGFLKVCGGKVLSLFQPSELMAMVVGNNNYNWDEMEKNAVYKGEYSASHPTVKIFWEVFHGFQLEKKKQFLLFLTGSDRIPIYGMESLQIVIQPTSAGEQYLPVAHTCYNLLDLPKYQTKEILRRRLTQAIEQYEGFSLV